MLRQRLHRERVGRGVAFVLRRLALHGADREAGHRQRERRHLSPLQRRAVRREKRTRLCGLVAVGDHYRSRSGHEADGCAAVASRRRPVERAVGLHAVVRRGARDGHGAPADTDTDAVLLAAHAAADALVHCPPAAHEELEERRAELAIQRRVDERVAHTVAVTCSVRKRRSANWDLFDL